MSFRIVDGSFKWLSAIAGIAKPELIADVAPNAADVFKKDLRVGFMSLLIKFSSMLMIWKGSLERYAPIFHTMKRGAYVAKAGTYHVFHSVLPNDQST
tara:strand:+ start:267 stop:560 length:294 start_codon:yes stop_codon:yes gene_type:complete